MRRGIRWVLLPSLMVVLAVAVAGCGSTGAALQDAGRAGSVSLSLTTVPTIRSVTVSPAKASFGTCGGGEANQNTRSTATRLGFPNGQCWVGLASPGIYPITITNTGIASDIYVNGSSASPADGGIQWSLCNTGDHPAVACTGRRNNLPGTDQYLVQNFSSAGEHAAGITENPACDREFDPSGGCWAVEGSWQTEGIELTGPGFSSDESTKWTVTITWTPVPSQG
jgi:hypothetical protein